MRADFRSQLVAAQAANGSMLCVGLDPEPAKFPGAWKGDAARIFDFCAAIVDATKDVVCAFKPQIAYFAAQRAEEQLERLIRHIHAVAPQVPVILDAKRGDIGATAEQYAREAFERYGADAVTLSPFMGHDSIEPYTRYAGKGLILLCRTSNPGGSDLQAQRLQDGSLLYEHIARLAAGEWNAAGQLCLVVGATFPAEVARVRELAPTLPLLIPGIGAQGGDAEATVRAGWRAGGPIVVSSSRAVLYASAGADFAAAARAVALATRDQLQQARPGARSAGRAPAGPQSGPHAPREETMEVKLDKRYPITATPAQAWAVLSDIRAMAACMPGAQITEQLDDTHYKGTVKSKVGPAVMNFGGDIELQGLDAGTRTLKMLGKGADKAGSSASMQLTASLEDAPEPGTVMLVGVATITVSGKLAQFGSRLLVPVSDALLAQFADNFRAAAQAVPVAAGAAPVAEVAPAAATATQGAASAPAGAPAPRANVAPAPVRELNALALMWTVFKGWLAGVFGRKS